MLHSNRCYIKKIIRLVFLSVVIGCTTVDVAHAFDQINLTKDASGWTIFTPSADSRIIYVAADGDNTTGEVYSKTSPEVGPDPFNPTGAIKPFKGIWNAYQQTRDNVPDWVLLKRGDSFADRIGFSHRSGRSKTEPSLIGAYGATGALPVLKLNDSENGMQTGPARSWLAVVGIDFYAYTRDPESPDYIVSTSGNSGVYMYADAANPHIGLLFEGCKFRATAIGMNIAYSTGSGGLTVRRCVFTDNYPAPSTAMGMLAGNITDFVLEENIFDKGGWYSQAGSGGPGPANMYNHNVYSGGLVNARFSNNIFMRPSSMNNKFTSDAGKITDNVTINNNLYVDGEIGIDMGGNDFGPYRFKNVSIQDNVITNMNMSRPTNRDIAYGIQVSDWDVGTVKNNLIIHSDSAGTYAFLPGYTSRNVTIDSNVVYDLKQVNAIYQSGSSTATGMVFSNNLIQQIELVGPIMNLQSAVLGNWTYLGNKYHANLTDSQRYSIQGVPKTLAQWQAETGDNSTFEQHSFPDPTRSIETYMASLGETATIDAFIAKARAQDRCNWDTRYTADAVNDYIRAGFGMGQRRLFRNVRLADPVE